MSRRYIYVHIYDEFLQVVLIEWSFNVHLADRMTYTSPAGSQCRAAAIVYSDFRYDTGVAVNTNIKEYLKCQPILSLFPGNTTFVIAFNADADRRDNNFQ